MRSSRYTCFVCDLPMDLDSKVTLRYVRGWARSTGKTLAIIDQEDHKFVHEFCLDQGSKKEDQLPLF